MVARALAACVAVVIVAAGSSCRRVAAPCCIDLLDQATSAEIRPVVHAPDAVAVVTASIAGEARRCLAVQVPSRVIFRVRIPDRAIFSTALGVDTRVGDEAAGGVAFGVGISDGRTYETLLEPTIVSAGTAWRPVRIDLRRYAGWQWSLFYRPSALTWQIVLNAYPGSTGADGLRALWALPAIDGDHP